MKRFVTIAALAGFAAAVPASAQTVRIDAATRHQTIDGFGTCISGSEGQQPWFQQLYFDDLRASMLRFDITPQYVSPYSDHHYNSPWYSNDPALPGPEGNDVRTYTGPSDYTRSYAGRTAQIAVMGPDIDQNVLLFDYSSLQTAGTLAELGQQMRDQLGDFKLIASMWSPAPWLKVASGNTYGGSGSGLPAQGTPYPFIWGGNFAGGTLDTSGTPLAVFDDGTGPTSALTQYARTLAAYLRGFQQHFGVSVYAVSIQNELNFEEFYNSATYPLSSQYIAALKAARAELDRYPDLAGIKLMGPEDLMGGDGWGMWQYGGGSSTTHKNLQYLQNIAADPVASAALDHFAIHGYASDGTSAAGAAPTQWQWWANGWTSAPAQGLPANVKGFTAYGKRSWMTETSGEDTAWLLPASGFPGSGAFSIAVKLHQALTAGQESAWLYWQLTDGKVLGAETLTDASTGAASPKYVAVKHFFHDIRPGAVRVDASVTGASGLLASAYVDDVADTIAMVLVNTDASPVSASVQLASAPEGIAELDGHVSSDGALWQPTSAAVASGMATVTVPGYGVMTLVGTGSAPSEPDAGAPPDAGALPDAGSPQPPDAGSTPSADAGPPEPGANPGMVHGTGCSGSGEPTTLAALLVAALAWRRRRPA